MSNQPEQPQPHVPPGYNAPPVPPYMPPVEQAGPPAQAAHGQAVPQPFAQPIQPAPTPYAQAPYGQTPYGQTPYGQPQQSAYNAPTYYQGGPGYMDATSGPKGLSLTSMIIGLAALLLGLGLLIVPQIVGIVMGHMALTRESPQGRGYAITGLITNYLSLLVYGLVVGIWIAIFALAIGSSATYS